MGSAHVQPYLDLYHLDGLLTDEQRLIMHSVRDFIQKTAQNQIASAYEQGQFPRSLIPQLGELGLLGSQLDGYGLPGLDAISYGLILRELERCDSGLRSFASVQGSLVMYPLHAFGSEAQKQEWLPKLATGEAIGCFGLTEADGGSDPAAMKTRAEFKNGQWQLSGSKMWITNGNLADIAIVWAQTEEGIRGFVVPLKAAGVTVKEMKGKLSLRASVTSELYFDAVQLPADAVLPGVKGLKGALSCLNQARYGISWGVIGAAEACLAEALQYTKDRILFQKPLSSFQLVQAKLAKIAVSITQAQLLAFRLGQLKDLKQLEPVQVSIAKQANVEMALETARTCRDILGGNGIMLEYSCMRHMNNLESVYTYEGTNDIHLLIIGQHLSGHSAFG